jgi:2-phosphosulfolactate phosphatase
MKINVILSPSQVDELYFSGKTSIVIDVLRATSTIIESLHNGAKEVIPVSSFEFAMKASGSFFGGNTLLGGERNTKRIEGFNLGNSPLEYTNKVVQGKSIILYTTNGTKAIVRAKFSETLILCAFTNISIVANFIGHSDKDIEILCSGRNNGFCIEDTVCAGRLISNIQKIKKHAVLTDSAKASVLLSNSYENNLQKLLSECEHGKILIENGFEKDIDYCAREAAVELIPIFHEGSIKIYSSVLVGNFQEKVS